MMEKCMRACMCSRDSCALHALQQPLAQSAGLWPRAEGGGPNPEMWWKMRDALGRGRNEGLHRAAASGCGVDRERAVRACCLAPPSGQPGPCCPAPSNPPDLVRASTAQLRSPFWCRLRRAWKAPKKRDKWRSTWDSPSCCWAVGFAQKSARQSPTEFSSSSMRARACA